MGIEYILYDKDSTEISAVVKELSALGYIVGKDFDFAFSTARYDYSNLRYTPRKTVFKFHNEELASWFVMRWS